MAELQVLQAFGVLSGLEAAAPAFRFLGTQPPYVTLFGKSRLNENSVEALFHCNAFSTR